MDLKHGPYSPSRLDTGMCGHSFFKQYVDPSRDRSKREGLAQARGSAVHEVFERITACFIKKEVPDDTTVKQWVMEAVNRHPAAYAEMDDVLAMARLYIQKPPAVLTENAEIELKLAVKHTGQDFEECDYDDPQAFARGRADIMLISDDRSAALVYDHKTQPNVEEADTFQMGFYAWVIFKTYPFLEQIQTVLHFARYGIYSEPYRWTRDQLAQIEEAILMRVGAIEQRQSWEATPNKNCQYCPFIAECPAMRQFVKIEEDGTRLVPLSHFKILGNQHKAEQIAGLIQVLEEAMKLCKAELKEHVKKAIYGVAIPGKIYEYRKSESIHWDKVNKSEIKQKVCDIFEKHGVDPKRFMGFTQTYTNDVWLLTENKALLEDLSSVLPRKAETEFRGYKA